MRISNQILGVKGYQYESLLMSTYNIQQVSMPLCGVKMCTDIF